MPQPKPAPVVNAPVINITGVYTGSSRVTGRGFLGIVVGSFPLTLKADLLDVAGAVTGTAEIKVGDEQPTSTAVQGTNTNGAVALTLQLPACEQTVSLTLRGTVNPGNRINFESVSKGVNCNGFSGTVVLDAFSITR